MRNFFPHALMTVLLSAELHIILPNTSTLLSESEIGDKYM